MKKIIIPFDGEHFSNGAFEFARNLNELEPILLTGVFLPDTTYSGTYGFTGLGVMEIPALISFLDDDTTALDTNIRHFKELCVKHGIEHRIHKGAKDLGFLQLEKCRSY